MRNIKPPHHHHGFHLCFLSYEYPLFTLIHGFGVDWVVCWFFVPYYGASMLPFTLLCCVYAPPCTFCAIQRGVMRSNEKCYPCHCHGFHLHHLSSKQPPSSCFMVLVLFGLLVGILCLIMVCSCSPSCRYAPFPIIVLHSEE